MRTEQKREYYSSQKARIAYMCFLWYKKPRLPNAGGEKTGRRRKWKRNINLVGLLRAANTD
jgi:hypothetical protein